MTPNLCKMPIRADAAGNGKFQAPRGGRIHRGVDLACSPDIPVQCVVAGLVTKLGYPYEEDLIYRYVEITDRDGLRHRYMYVSPSVSEGDQVEAGSVIGLAQNVAKKHNSGLEPEYQLMIPHIHYEVWRDSGRSKTVIDPSVFIGRNCRFEHAK